MAIPTLFRIIADFVGIGFGVVSNQPHVTPELNETLRANNLYHSSGRPRILPDKERNELQRRYYSKIRESGLEHSNASEYYRLQREVMRQNYSYLDDYFKRRFPHLK